MKELNTVEIKEVSGAGVITDAATALGDGIGAIIEAAGVKGARDAAAALGSGIGAVVEAGVDTLKDLFGGLFGRKK